MKYKVFKLSASENLWFNNLSSIMFILIISVSSLMTLKAQNFEKYFEKKQLRVDFIFGGNSKETRVYLLELRKEPFYGGPIANLTDKSNYGQFKYELYDQETSALMYSRSFSALFEEWVTTEEAKKVDKAFYQSITMPMPLKDCELRLSKRQRNGEFVQIFSTTINPKSYFIQPEMRKLCSIDTLLYNGDPSVKTDLVFVAEGYSREELNKFKADAKRLTEYTFSQKPFSEHKSKFNIWIVNSVSGDSGTDIPGKDIFRNTTMNTTFYTFDIDRYMCTYDYLSVRDIAANAPCDHICVLVNSEKYGGGGIYNHFTMSTVDHNLSDKVFIHELGHGFGGLGDEYYSSSVAYQDFYNMEIEPWEPNLTTLKNFDLKWKNLITKETPIPTPNEKEFKKVTGVFEGGGYSAKGIYRPALDCRMKSNEAEGFCEVCQKAIEKMILFYCGEKSF